jgi:transcription elongation GreA/GreB family factor
MNGKERTIAIVGDDEAEPKSGMLAFSAPLCRAIMDAAVGEHVSFGLGSDTIEVLEIAPPEDHSAS